MAPAARRARVLAMFGTLVVFAVLVVPGGSLPAHASEAPQLPDLVSEPPTSPELVLSSEGGTNRFLLRFNGYVHNEGDGALDIRGKREAPKVAGKTQKQVEEEVERARVKEESLPQKLEEELAKPPMEVKQRLFLPRTGAEEEQPGAIEDPHEESASTGTMLYANADGHHHWHLQHVAKYGLWNPARSAEVVPSQKVGFCLEDSEEREHIGPAKAVYEDQVRGDFCQFRRPNATSLIEGISPGWRDRYLANLAFQWVDVSSVSPGEYWLGEEVNPDKFIIEANPENEVSFAGAKTVVPGFVAQGQTVKTEYENSVPITLKASEYSAPPKFPVNSSEAIYERVSGPAHGTLSAIAGKAVTYTPAAGYSGTDSFTFKTRDKNSEFPREPVVATVSITVGEGPPPTIAITAAPSGLTAGTSATITAATSNPNEAVKWSVSGGTITAEPPLGHTATYAAPATPPAGGAVTVTARPLLEPGVAERVISITPVPAATPALEPPPAPGARTGAAGIVTAKSVYLTRPRAMLDGTELVVSTVPALPGRVELRAYLRKRLLGLCKASTPANRRFTCHMHLRSAKLARQKISIVASLRTAGKLLTAELPAERIPRLRMAPVSKLQRSAHAAAASIFWCSPGTMEETLTGEQ